MSRGGGQHTERKPSRFDFTTIFCRHFCGTTHPRSSHSRFYRRTKIRQTRRETLFSPTTNTHPNRLEDHLQKCRSQPDTRSRFWHVPPRRIAVRPIASAVAPPKQASIAPVSCRSSAKNGASTFPALLPISTAWVNPLRKKIYRQAISSSSRTPISAVSHMSGFISAKVGSSMRRRAKKASSSRN